MNADCIGNRIKEIQSSIQEQWGKKHSKKRDLKNIERLYDEGLYEDFLPTLELEKQNYKENYFKLDKTTWKDLDIYNGIKHMLVCRNYRRAGLAGGRICQLNWPIRWRSCYFWP